MNIYDRYLRERGNVPNMFRTMAHRLETLETIIAHMEAVLNTGTLPKASKELVIVRTSQLNRIAILFGFTYDDLSQAGVDRRAVGCAARGCRKHGVQ